MITSLGRSTARATTRNATYICLRCRADHQLASQASQSDAGAPPSLPTSDSNTGVRHITGEDLEIDGAITDVNHAWKAAKAYMDQKKLVTPKVKVKGDEDSGYKVSLKLDGKKFETSLYNSRTMARTKAKLLAIEYLHGRKAADLQQGETLFAESQEEPATAPDATVLTGPTTGRLRVRKLATSDTRRARQLKSKEAARAKLAKERSLGGVARSVLSHRSEDTDDTADINAENESSPMPARARLLESRAALYERVTPAPSTRGLSRLRKPLLLKTRPSIISTDSRPGARKLRQKRSSPEGKSIEEIIRQVGGRTGERSSSFESSRIRSAKSKQDLKLSQDARTFEPLALERETLDVQKQTVPSLSYGLDRVLFNPGVYHVQDPRSRVYNFDPYLQKILHPKHFDFASLDEFKSPSSDNTLSSVAEKHKVKYFSSTSAITGVLSHLHYLLSDHRLLSFEDLSAGFLGRRSASKLNADMKGDFTTFFKSPQSIYLKPKQGGYAIDKAEDKPSSSLLSFVGHCLEKLFTVPKEAFEMYKKGSETKPERPGNAYHYTKFDSVLVRSQLDAHDDRLPGEGMFDIKTRAVLPLRMDTLEAQQTLGTNYEIKNLTGEFESFEREFYDMSRATMLKYSLQARLGRMDGIFVAFHNIARIFGFQYLSLSDMDKILHGQADTVLGDAELSSSFRILTEVFDKAVETYPDEPLRLYFESRKREGDMIVYVVPVAAEVIEQQHENAQCTSREYLARLNKSKRQTIEAIQEELQADEVGAEQPLEATSEGSSWLDVSKKTEQNSEGQEDSQGISLESAERVDEFDEEIGRLSALAARVNQATDILRAEGISEDRAKLQKTMLAGIAKKTFALEKGINDLAALLPVSDEVSDVAEDLRTLRKSLNEQKHENEELFELAEQKQIVTGVEIKDLTNSQTLEEALKAATKRYTAPERISAFQVRAQSHLNGAVLTEPPTNITKKSKWEVTYTIDNFRDQDDGLQQMFVQMLKRQDQAPMSSWDSGKLRQFYDGAFFAGLMKLSKEGKRYRKELDKEDEKREVVVFEPKSG